MAGPSGAGECTRLDGARAALAGDARFHFGRRVVSRPAEAGGDAHEVFPAEAFARGDPCLRWVARRLHYGTRRAEVTRARR